MPSPGTRLLLAWLARVAATGVGAVALVQGSTSVVPPDLGLTGVFLGLAVIGAVLVSFTSTTRVGLVVAGVGAWAGFTWYGAYAIVHPFSAVLASLGGRHPLETEREARIQGVVVLVAVNLLAASYLWWLHAQRRRSHRSS